METQDAPHLSDCDVSSAIPKCVYLPFSLQVLETQLIPTFIAADTQYVISAEGFHKLVARFFTCM